MVSDQLLVKKGNQNGKYRLRYESMLKAMPPDIRQELAKRKLEEINEIDRRKQTSMNEQTDS